MAFTKIWVHCVWGTKKRIPFLTQKKWEILNHIKENAGQKDIYIDSINGGIDHVHCLISLKADQTIAKVIQIIKGESSFWINKNKLTETKFEWADEYFAISVSESQLKVVREYIRNQEEHHKKKMFNDEYEEFIRKYKFEKIKG
jgi:REP element-mobilizing transposase RayT